MYTPTLDLLQAVKGEVENIQLPAPLEGTAFASVQVYAHENLVGAMSDLLVFEDRACFIVPTSNRYTNQREGRVLTSQRETEFVLLITDRVYGGKFDAEALLGNTETPGIVRLQELVVTALTGQSLDLKNVCLLPSTGEPFRIAKADQEANEGRECWAQPFTTPAGEMRVDRASTVPSRYSGPATH